MRDDQTAFHRLHDKGHIYRDWALISYSPGLDSAISDLEIEREDEQTTLYYLGYPLSDGTYLEIATTSLHTIGADRALIINPEHPERPRFEALTAINPFTHESMPIIFDDQIDLEFGSGAMKCTPLHDQTDWELAKKHDLEMGYPAMSLSGEMTHLAESLHGLTIAEAREAAPDLLKRFIIRTEPHTQPIPRCTRTKARIETLPAWQWHLDTKELGAPIIEALQNGEIEIHPETQRERMITWLQEGRPWCLSRQLWWGHQIPMHEDEMGNWHTDPGEGRTQDQDILDTWFSSALWSLASLGWPDKNADFDRYYPIDSIISGRDILNLWISRMLMLGHFFTGQLPFKKIYLHGTILDKHGKPMSKTRGNGIDPRDLQKQHGTDSTRFAIMSLASSQDIRWQTHAPERAARTLRKLYNASRLLGKPSNEICEPQNELQYWIESKFNHLIGEFEQGLDQAGWHRPCKALEYFLEKEFCPWYLEAYKLDKEGEFAYAKYLLFRILSIASIICPNMTTYLLEGLDPAWPPDARATEGSELIESTWQAIHLRRRGQDHQHISRDELLFRGIR